MSARTSLAAAVATAVVGAAMTSTGLLGVGAATANASGTASHFALTRAPDVFTGQLRVVRWAPCIRRNGVTHLHVIRYRVNPAHVPSRVALVKKGVAKLSAVTGLKFKYVGTTSYLPHFDLVPGGQVFAAHDQQVRTGVPLVIAWANQGSGAHRSNLLTGTEAGVGTIAWRSSLTSQLRIIDGAVVIDRVRSKVLRGGFGAGGTVGTLLLHELGHVVGLRHVADQSQVMFPVIGANSPAGYGAGDKTGLHKVGRAAGCMRTS